MNKSAKVSLSKLASYTMMAIGMFFVVFSALIVSSFLAILGIAIICWVIILLYITPIKHVPITLLTASTISAAANIERILENTNMLMKGKYLPPTLLKDFESSFIYISEQEVSLSKPQELQEENTRGFNFITPPGLALSKLFEQQIGTSFSKTDLKFIQEKLPRVFVEDMELAQAVDIQVNNNTVRVELKSSVLLDVCIATRSLPRTHSQVGCLLSSALACVLAKVSGKVVTIEKDDFSDDGRVTILEFKLWEE